MVSKTLICVQRLCRIEIIPDYTGVGLGRCHCIKRVKYRVPHSLRKTQDTNTNTVAHTSIFITKKYTSPLNFVITAVNWLLG